MRLVLVVLTAAALVVSFVGGNEVKAQVTLFIEGGSFGLSGAAFGKYNTAAVFHIGLGMPVSQSSYVAMVALSGMDVTQYSVAASRGLGRDIGGLGILGLGGKFYPWGLGENLYFEGGITSWSYSPGWGGLASAYDEFSAVHVGVGWKWTWLILTYEFSLVKGEKLAIAGWSGIANPSLSAGVLLTPQTYWIYATLNFDFVRITASWK